MTQWTPGVELLPVALTHLDAAIESAYLALRQAGLSADATLEALRTHAADAAMTAQRNADDIPPEHDEARHG